MPIWLRPEPGTRRPRFTRDQIARTALAIADAEGFDAVSMRRVASELGAGTMTLYHYVSNKDDLIELMDDALMGEVLVPPDELPLDDWRAALRRIAEGSLGAFLRHPWALDALTGSAFGPNGTRHFDQSLAAVSSLRLSAREKMELLATVDDYVFGFVMRLQTGMRDRDGADYQDPANFDAMLDYAERLLATGDYPHIRALLGDGDRRAVWREIAASWSEERFSSGLDRLLDGIELDLRRRGVLPGG
jgi:AcrR family transcriptional regulator